MIINKCFMICDKVPGHIKDVECVWSILNQVVQGMNGFKTRSSLVDFIIIPAF